MQRYRTALILGAGLSGLGAARLLTAEGTAVTVADARPEKELAVAAQVLQDLGARTHFGQSHLPWEAFELGVVSPGFAWSSDWVQAAYAICARIVPELELGWSRAPCRVMAVTGSNGKSTAVKWCTETLIRAGLQATPAGNYGVSVCDAVLDHTELDWLVLEVSSFQLETVQEFRADIGLLTNIHPNHLDRHQSLSAYTDLKARLFARTRAEDVCLVPHALLDEIRARSGGAGRWMSFGSVADARYRFQEGQVLRDGTPIADLRGTHFGTDAMADTASATVGGLDAVGVDPRHAVATARSFESLPYRVQEVAVLNGVRYINDSKSTNLAAIEFALGAVTGPVRLIAGGLAKETDFERLKEVLEDRVESVYLIGNSAEQMFSVWSRAVSCVVCNTLDEAIRQSGNDAQEGEAILFSPGCASFDQFRNYEERGEYFTRRVQDLTGKGTS